MGAARRIILPSRNNNTISASRLPNNRALLPLRVSRWPDQQIIPPTFRSMSATVLRLQTSMTGLLRSCRRGRHPNSRVHLNRLPREKHDKIFPRIMSRPIKYPPADTTSPLENEPETISRPQLRPARAHEERVQAVQMDHIGLQAPEKEASNLRLPHRVGPKQPWYLMPRRRP